MKMRKWVLAFVGLLVSASAQAHVSAVPFPEIGSLSDVTHQAAFSIVQTYLPPTTPQIFYNIVTDAGAACNGDVLTVTRTASITSGTKNLAVTVNTFSSGDVGKTITIEGAGDSGGRYYGKIATFTNTQNVVLDANATTTLSAVSTSITYGTSDAPAFDTFNNWARANQGSSNQVVLTVPNGANCWFGNGTFNYVNLFNAFAAGINNLIVEGTGATISSVGGRGFFLGGLGICAVGLTQAAGCSARIQSVSPGAMQVTLTSTSLAAGYISRFSVNQWIMIGGLDIQGLFQSAFGYPPNSNYFEWRQVTAVNAGTGVITLDRPISNTYLSTWAQYNSGSVFEADAGGPATIWAVGGVNNTWNSTVEYRGLTISQEGQTYANARNVTYRNITFGNFESAIPTQNETWSAYNTTFNSVNMETDKLVGTMLMDGVTIAQIVFQSSSTDLFIMRNSTVTNRLDGGAKRTEISDSTLASWGPGFFAYGNSSGASICTRCTITALDTVFSGNYQLSYNPFPYTMNSGLITVPNSVTAAQGPFVPGTRILYATAGYFLIGSAQIITVTGDSWPAADNQTATTNVTTVNGSNSMTVSTSPFVSGDVDKVIIVPGARNSGGNPADLRTFITGVSGAGPQTITLFDNATRSQSAVSQTLQWGTSNTYAQTTSPGGFPNISALTAAPIAIAVKGTPNFTCDQCNVGSPATDAYGMSVQAGATPGAPLATYITRSFTTSSVASQGTLPSYGKLVKLTVDVTQPFVGTGAPLLNPTGQFHNFTVNQSGAYTQFDWFPTINLKQAGKREIFPGGVTCDTGGGPVAGGCAGDTINSTNGFPPNAVWVQKTIDPWTAGNFTGMITPPTYTITMQTDQSP